MLGTKLRDALASLMDPAGATPQAINKRCSPQPVPETIFGWLLIALIQLSFIVQAQSMVMMQMHMLPRLVRAEHACLST